jgi:kumamolisin
MTARRAALLYGFPSHLDGSGQCIALLAFSTPPFDGAPRAGGFHRRDLALYFRGLGLHVPRVEAVSVAGARNRPGENLAVDLETTLGICVAGAVAPAARIAVYFAPNSERGVRAAIRAAAADRARRPSVICMSWGAPESSWTKRGLLAIDAACHAATRRGITVVASSGDRGSGRGVEFPASSPWVLACGGTRLIGRRGRIARETAWDEGDGQASGGGYSARFRRPAWQDALAAGRRFVGRGVPDVAANASFDTAFRIVYAGRPVLKGGTSAAAPLWAGLIALLAQGLGRRIGHLHPLLYGELAGKVCRRVGRAGGWSARTGWGSPDGERLLAALRSLGGNVSREFGGAAAARGRGA